MKAIISITLILLMPIMSLAEDTLTEALSNQAKASKAKIPTEQQSVMAKATAELKASGITEKAIKLGSTLPNGKLLDPHGKSQDLYEAIGTAPAVITFYRGGWCPYCNIQLRYYQQALPEFKKLGANLIAISPEAPDNTLSTSQKNELEFGVFSDTNNAYAKELGLVFELNDELKDVYKSFGINLEKANNSDKWELPLAASFVIDKDKKLIYSFVTPNYTERASVEDLLQALKSK